MSDEMISFFFFFRCKMSMFNHNIARIVIFEKKLLEENAQ